VNVAIPTHQRRDAERNHEAIVTAAIVVLADDPEATMAEIASASGIGRSTLYRHFPDRVALVSAIYGRVVSEAGTIITRRLEEGGDEEPAGVLIDLIAELGGLGDRYRFLVSHEEFNGKHHVKRWPRPTPLGQFVARAQTAGTLRGDLDTEWLTLVLGHLIGAAARYEFTDAAARRAMIEATVRSLLTPA
jgi:AcrR family transcriptional regulator